MLRILIAGLCSLSIPARQQLQLPAVVYSTAAVSGGVIAAADVTDLQGGVR